MAHIQKDRGRFREWRGSLLLWGLVVMGLGVILIAGSLQQTLVPDSDTAWEVVKALGEAGFIAGIFTFTFELFGKKQLIEETVEQAAGQVRAVTFGLYDFATTPREIDYGEAFELSNDLYISSRYSAEVLIPYRDQLIDRFRAKRTLTFLRQKELDPDLPGLPAKRASSRQSAYNFFIDLLVKHPEFAPYIEFKETELPFMYNFVAIDAGLWIKLYYNAGSDEPPPAFFAKRKTPFYELYRADINRLLTEAVSVALPVPAKDEKTA